MIKSKKPQEIFLWGVCDQKTGESWLYAQHPVLEKDKWINPPRSVINIPPKSDLPDNLFPTDKPQKFKLVPIDEQEAKND